MEMSFGAKQFQRFATSIATSIVRSIATSIVTRIVTWIAVCLGAAMLHLSGWAQQPLTPANAPAKVDLPFYDIVAGYAYLYSTNIKLPENGFQFQAGVTPRPWLTLGFDYSVATGQSKLTPGQVPPALAQQLGALLAQLAAAGQLPPGYALVVPFNVLTQTFAAGPQFNVHRFRHSAVFVRPSIGAVREQVTARPKDPIQTLVVQHLVPGGNKTDWQGFYGFGGGFDYDLTRHFGVRVQADEVYDHLFDDLLKDGRWTTRVGGGLSFRFGQSPFHR
jgi:hypothetical protein